MTTYTPGVDHHPPSYEVTTSTPWGRADFAYRYGRGIISYSCPGHGGFHLSATRNAQVHEAWRRSDGWYEEDCEWAIVAVTFPEVFHPEHVEMAHVSLKSWLPHEYETVTGTAVTLEESHVLRREAFEDEHVSDWVTVSAFGDWADWVPKGKVGVSAVLGGRRRLYGDPDPPTRYFWVDADRYVDRGEFGYVCDGTIDTPCVGPKGAR